MPSTIVGEDRITDETIATIAGVKVIKRGQMCVTVDYCLVPENKLTMFTDKLVTYMKANFSDENGAASSCGIINDRHVVRLQKLIDEAKQSQVQK